MATRVQRLNDLFIDSDNEKNTLKHIHAVLSMAIQNIIMQTKSVELMTLLEKLTDSPLGNITTISGSQMKKLVLMNLTIPAQYKDKEYELRSAMNTIQDTICESLKITLKFNHSFEVSNEIFFIEQQRLNKDWEKMVDSLGGFDINLLTHPKVIDIIQSSHAYRDLLSWSAKYQLKGRSLLILHFLNAIVKGNLEWYTCLVKCVKNIIQSPSTEPSNQMNFVVPHLFFNDKNTEEGRVNLQQLFIELYDEVDQLIKHKLFRHSSSEKNKDDITRYTQLLCELAQSDANNAPRSPHTIRKR